MPNTDLNIYLKLKDQASKGISQVQSKLQSFSESFKRNWLGITAAITASIFAIKKGWDVLEFGAKMEQQERAFKNLASSYHVSAQQIIKDLDTAADGTLTTMQLIDKASKAMTLGLDPDQLDELMTIARASAKAMGQSVDFMYDSIVTGIGRQSKLILDNLGIIVSVGKANEDYAKQIGKTVEQLTEAEKRQAFFNAVVSAGQEIVERVGMSNRTNAENLQIIKSSLAEAAQQVALFITNSADLTEVADKFKEVANATKEIRKGFVFDQMASVMEKMQAMKEPNIFGKIKNFFVELDSSTFGTRSTSDALKDLSEQLGNLIIRAKEMGSFVSLEEYMPFLSADDLERVAEKLREIDEEVETTGNAVVEAGEKSQESLIVMAAGIEDFAAKWNVAFTGIIKKQETLATGTAKVIETQINTFSSGIGTAFAEMLVNGKNFKESLDQLWKDMAASFIQEVTAMMAKWLAFTALQGVLSLFSGGTSAGVTASMAGFMHSGGPIVKAHSGLAVDEVPIIAQTGEGILSRRGMAALGGNAALNSVNAGNPVGGGVTIYMDNVSVRSQADIEALANEISYLMESKRRSRI